MRSAGKGPHFDEHHSRPRERGLDRRTPRREVQRSRTDHGEAVPLDGVGVRSGGALSGDDGDVPADALANRVGAVRVVWRERELLRGERRRREQRGDPNARRGHGTNNARSIASAMSRYPASLGWRWSPESADGKSRAGWAGSRRDASKSITASNAP